MTQILLVILLEWTQAATAQVDARLQAEWTAIVRAHKTFGAWRVEVRGQAFDGDLVVRTTTWTYYLRGGDVRCRQQGTDYITCGTQDVTPLSAARIAIRAVPQPAITLATMRMVHRALFGKGLEIDYRGRATIETIVSTPNAEQRTSRRYRVRVTFSERAYTLDAPHLVEQYDETCYAVHGCHATHWTCQRP